MALLDRAKNVLPLGVSSPLRACLNVGHETLFVESGRGEEIIDHNGKRYVDFLFGFGPNILGHAPDCVVEAVRDQIGKGSVFATGHRLEVELAERIREACPHVEQIRFVSTGTEAVMSAVRLARSLTKRKTVLRFRGGYHGHSDVAQQTEHDDAARGLASSDQSIVLFCEYNDIDGLQGIFDQHGSSIAAALIEPIGCNSSLIPLAPVFLKKLRALCNDHGAILIFDEVITGFRIRYGVVSEEIGVTPDITTFGKIIGGGLPIGAYGGSVELMRPLQEQIVYQSGTFSGNPLSMAAGIAVLDELRSGAPYAVINQNASYFRDRISDVQQRSRVQFALSMVKGTFCFQFAHTTVPASRYSQLQGQDRAKFAQLYHLARKRGIHLAPDVDEVMYISSVTTKEAIDRLVDVVSEAVGDQHSG